MVMEILGHSQISTTSDVCTHVMPDAWLDSDGDADENAADDAG